MNEQKIKGLITELQCQTYFTQRGFNVSIPLNEDCRYDMIVDFNGILSRIQVKTCSISATGITIPCRSVQVNTKAAKAKNMIKTKLIFLLLFTMKIVILLELKNAIEVKPCLSRIKE